MGWWKLRRSPTRIRVLDSMALIIVRVIGPFEAGQVGARLIELTDQRPETSVYRMIFDFRLAAGVIKDTDSEQVRDHHHRIRQAIGLGDAPDGPHALIGTVHDSLEAIADSHRELHPVVREVFPTH